MAGNLNGTDQGKVLSFQRCYAIRNPPLIQSGRIGTLAKESVEERCSGFSGTSRWDADAPGESCYATDRTPEDFSCATCGRERRVYEN
jgi:hypothetical protein